MFGLVAVILFVIVGVWNAIDRDVKGSLTSFGLACFTAAVASIPAL